jgi:hypothetical protein
LSGTLHAVCDIPERQENAKPSGKEENSEEQERDLSPPELISHGAKVEKNFRKISQKQ